MKQLQIPNSNPNILKPLLPQQIIFQPFADPKRQPTITISKQHIAGFGGTGFLVQELRDVREGG